MIFRLRCGITSKACTANWSGESRSINAPWSIGLMNLLKMIKSLLPNSRARMSSRPTVKILAGPKKRPSVWRLRLHWGWSSTVVFLRSG